MRRCVAARSATYVSDGTFFRGRKKKHFCPPVSISIYIYTYIPKKKICRSMYVIVRGSSSFVINADSCFFKVQGFISHSHQNFSSSSNFLGYGILFNSPTLLVPEVGSTRLPLMQSEGHNHCVMFIMMSFTVPPKKNLPTEEV